MNGTVTIGIDLGGTGTRIVARAGDGTIAGEASMPTASVDGAGGLIAAIRGVSDGLAIEGIGIGASGPVDSSGVIRNPATLPTFSDIPLRATIEDRLGVRCLIDNDAVTAALGEHAYGAGRGSDALLMLTLGTGVGVCVLGGGHPFRAADGSHPEAGHIAVDGVAAPCYCGLSNCWEQLASRTALDRMVAEGPDLKPFERYGVVVAAGLSTLLTIFRPDRVVIGGSTARHLDLFLPALRDSLPRSEIHASAPPIVPAELGDLSGAIGAAELLKTPL